MKELLTTLGGLKCRVLQGDELPPRLAVVLCHGFGAPGDDLVSLAGALVRMKPALGSQVRFIFPEAPLSLEEFGYLDARAWWHVDVGRFQRAALKGPEALAALAEDVPDGLAPARRMLQGTLDALMKTSGLSMNRIVLGGFSQGAMLTTDLTMRLEEAPAALGIFSGTVICRSEWVKRAPVRKGLEAIVSHGTQDQILPYFGAEALRTLLTEAGWKIDFLPFTGPHTIHPKALERFAALLESRFPK